MKVLHLILIGLCLWCLMPPFYIEEKIYNLSTAMWQVA
jgi:hypothetical protein